MQSAISSWLPAVMELNQVETITQEFVKQTPSDSIIPHSWLVAKFRFNDLDLGEIGGLPRLMDMGQCNDAYGAIQVAVALADAFGCSVNELPLSFVLSWY